MNMSLFTVMLLFLQFFFFDMFIAKFKQISRLDPPFLLSALDMY